MVWLDSLSYILRDNNMLKHLNYTLKYLDFLYLKLSNAFSSITLARFVNSLSKTLLRFKSFALVFNEWQLGHNA